jgi:hypothetical protein
MNLNKEERETVDPLVFVPGGALHDLLYGYEAVLSEMRKMHSASRSLIAEWVGRIDSARDDFVQRRVRPTSSAVLSVEEFEKLLDEFCVMREAVGLMEETDDVQIAEDANANKMLKRIADLLEQRWPEGAMDEGAYRGTDCTHCGRCRVQDDGVCDKCNWDNDGNDWAFITRPDEYDTDGPKAQDGDWLDGGRREDGNASNDEARES